MNFVVIRAINLLIQIIEYAILARVLLSWIPLPDNQFTRMLYQITDPILEPIRNLINKSPLGNNSLFSMIDFSPLIAFALIGFLRNIIINILLSL
jgi:YGGT family.